MKLRFVVRIHRKGEHIFQALQSAASSYTLPCALAKASEKPLLHSEQLRVQLCG